MNSPLRPHVCVYVCTGSKHDWSYIEKQRGWFAYTGLTSVQVRETACMDEAVACTMSCVVTHGPECEGT